MRTTFVRCCLLLGLIGALGITSPAAASTGQPEVSSDHQLGGRVMVVVGVGVQAVGFGLALGNIFASATGSSMWSEKFLYDPISSAAAPVMIAGFRLALTDGTQEGDLRATSIGLFQSAAYTGVLVLLNALSIEAEYQWLVQQPIDEDGPGHESLGGLFYGGHTIITAAVCGALLVPAVATALHAKHLQNTAAAASARHHPIPVFAPMPLQRGGGASMGFVF